MTRSSVLDLWLWPLEAARTAVGVAETFSNAQAVIAKRTPKITSAMRDPLNADSRELTRMVTEKVDAFGRSGKILTDGQGKIQAALSAQAKDLGRFAGGEIFGPADWMRIANRNVELWSAMVNLPGASLHPVRTRVSKNARRLKR
ncbi:hypothetical protein NDN01_22595 [Sphingomonas sp. QA11]|uniref:hypothetical protein n=1 Tax=Sphingomonas sp. QA11 TaxID=2950605 RepID=UPI00234A5574|nr:hypothetical protein [Sphingomonas sp. QA11]WCM26754.1 hypothetical protein NDN01_22595 [Sphingomonas sp. QA11]